MSTPPPAAPLARDQRALWWGVVAGSGLGIAFGLLFLVGALNGLRVGTPAVAWASEGLTGVAVLLASGYGLRVAVKRLHGGQGSTSAR